MARGEGENWESVEVWTVVRPPVSGPLSLLSSEFTGNFAKFGAPDRAIARSKPLLEAGEQHFSSLLNIIVWVKSNGGMGALYRSQHELVALFKNGNGAHKNNVALGANGRYHSNV